MSESGSSESVDLPAPRLRGERSLEEALAGRRSVRGFADKPLTDGEISQLLWATQGITHPAGRRAAPSAGAVYPLELYVAKSSGLWHFEPGRHGLTLSHAVDLREAMYGAALGQSAILEAPAVFVITAVLERMQTVYGARAERYIHMEVGHAAENLLLQAVSLDLGGVLIGAFNDHRLNKLLQLANKEAAMYLVPVGHPR